jgi:hypothetical protein
MELNQAVISNAHAMYGFSDGVTKYIPGCLQNCFENGIAALRDADVEVNPYNFAIGFWQKMIEMTRNGTSINLQSYIRYIGNVDLESFDDGFADVILDINSGASSTGFDLQPDINGLTITQFGEAWCNNMQYENEEYNGNYYIHGWKGNDSLPITGRVAATGVIGVGNREGWNNPWNTSVSVFDQLVAPNSTVVNEFDFNTIVVLYDIEDASGNVIYTGIPMGMYLNGAVTAQGIRTMHIYNSSDVAYGAGSGWALRICTKFSPTPYGNLQVEEVALESKAINTSISALMSATAEAIKTVNSFAEKSLVSVQTLKDLYGNFKNTRTNVPYAVSINGVGHWFVNGRDTGVLTDGTILEQ